MRKLFENARADIPAGIVVFLVAVPLCLGIALASGAPLFAGLLSGVIGGIVVGAISKARLSVSGPAAGLTAVVLAAIGSLGSFDKFLVALVLAGVLQLVAAAVRAGTLANYFPSSVIKGMLTAIGLIIVLKQIPHAFGYDANTEGDLAFLQPDGETTFSALLKPLWHVDVGATCIAALSLAVLILWERPFMKPARVLPGPLVAVAAGVALNALFGVVGPPGLQVQGEHLVRVPVLGDLSELGTLFTFPDFSQLLRGDVWLIAVTLAAVATLETLLCIEAVDKLDPYKRVTPPNRELVAQGTANVLCGLLGGLPVTSVIVRSSANLAAGARSRLSTITHGVLILGFVLLLPQVLNLIPLASLAAVLLMVGFKLARPSLLMAMWRLGKYQAIPFFVTIVAILFTDLLVGVAIGLAAAVFAILRGNMKSPYYFHRAEHHTGDIVKLELAEEVSFLNKASILWTLEHVPLGSIVHIDATRTKYIDYDVLEVIREFVALRAPERNITTRLIGFAERYALRSADHVHVITTDRRERGSMTPSDVLAELRAGNQRFLATVRLDRDLHREIRQMREGLHPVAAVVGCVDSRTSPTIVFDQGIGDLLSVRLAGHVITDEVLGSLEFACAQGAKVIVVLGHTKCGAVRSACAHVRHGHLSTVLAHFEPALTSVGAHAGTTEPEPSFVDAVAHNHAILSARAVTARSPELARRVERGELLVVAGLYEIATGEAQLFEPAALHAPESLVKIASAPR